MADYLIRKARENDLQILQDIARRTIDARCRLFIGDEKIDWYISSGECDEAVANSIGKCAVLVKQSVIVGYCVYFDDLVHTMMVDVKHHRSGFGSMLLSYAEQALRSSGHEIIRLKTYEGNDQAINFYIKNGWRITRKGQASKAGLKHVLFEKDCITTLPVDDL